MTEGRSSAEIEREIEAERGALAGTIRDLRDSVSLEAVVHRVADGLRDNGSDIAGAVSRQVRENPLGVALTGIGLAWLMMGPRRSPDRRRLPPPHDSYYDDDDMDWEADLGTRRAGAADFGSDDRFGSTGDRFGSGGDTFGSADDDGFGDLYGSPRPQFESSRNGSGDGDGSGQGLGSRASAAMGRAAERIGGGARRARSGASDRADRVRAGAGRLRARMDHGLEGFSQAARERVLAARKAAVDARENAERAARQGRQKMADAYDNAPLVTGALALAVGAALGSLLPRTETEDDLMGAESDRLMDDAMRIYDEEKARLKDAGAQVAEAGKKAAGDVADAAGQAASSVAAGTGKGGAEAKSGTKEKSGSQDSAAKGAKSPAAGSAAGSGPGLAATPEEPPVDPALPPRSTSGPR